MYKPVVPKANFPALEEEIFAFRKKNDAFHKSSETRVKA
jgi:hypothetical protein